MDISGKVAIVTGGAQGIGRAVTECLLKKGARGVTITDVHEQKGQETVNEFSQQYDQKRVTFMYADVTLKSQMEDVFRQTKTTFGRVDILICNAGICNEYEWERMVDINFASTIRNTYLAVEYMGTKNGGNGGVIIINSSLLGLIPNSIIPVYAAAKSGLVGFARSVAFEPMMSENAIRVAAICPGAVNTQIRNSLITRYDEIMQELMKTETSLEPYVIGDHVVTMIEDAKYNGCACVVTHDVPFSVVDPPEIVHSQCNS